MDFFAARATSSSIPVTLVPEAEAKRWKKGLSKLARNWVDSSGFSAKPGKVAKLPGRDGKLAGVAVVVSSEELVWNAAALRAAVPKGRYFLADADKLSDEEKAQVALGWGLASYRFGRYKSKPAAKAPVLAWPEGVDQEGIEAVLEGIFLARDLVNTPAEDMGPAELVQAGKDLAARHGGKAKVIKGKGLLEQNFPAVHAVGRAASRDPQLLDLRWGDASAPKVTLVGKGVVFDSGGLDLKSAAGMKLMKKDMGGAAAVLALAHMIMACELPVCLRVLVPAVENAIGGNAFRPMDVLQTRKGITVEVGNTDAEGRLILCDALAEADGESPELLIDFATLTGAARVALGTELPALFSTNDDIAQHAIEAGLDVADPVWRMPLFRPYRRHLDSKVADINNISSVAQGGAITAALFLQEFVSKGRDWIHIDTMGWNTSSRPGRPAGGEGLAVRAIFRMLEERYPLEADEDDSEDSED